MSDSIWVLQYISRNWDYGRNTTETLEEDEGFFTSEAEARERCEQLNAGNRERWAQTEASKRRQYDLALALWEDQQRQREFLSASGFTPPAPTNPPVEPQATTYEDWLWQDGGRGDWETLELHQAHSR